MWPFHGTMRAKSNCSLALLNALKFQKTACQFMSRNANPVQYGKEIVKQINRRSRSELTDLRDPEFDLETTALSVFSFAECQRERESSLTGWFPMPRHRRRSTVMHGPRGSHERRASVTRAIADLLERNKIFLGAPRASNEFPASGPSKANEISIPIPSAHAPQMS